MELIKAVDIHKTYNLGEIDVPVLNGISFTIERGELVALMGASGSGKSTLMNILGCLDRPTSGQYWFDGREIGRLSANERALVRSEKLGFVFQSFNLLARTAATNNVAMPLDYSVRPVSAVAALDRATELLERVGLGHRLDHMSSQMSGGQQQRVAIARALVNRPSLLLADEPTGNLDSHTSVEILQMFRELNASGITVLLVTHDPEVAAYADRVIHIVDGVIDSDTGTKNHSVVAPHFGENGNGIDNGHANGAPLTEPGGNGSLLTVVETRSATKTTAPKRQVAEPQPKTRPKRSIRRVLSSLFPPTLRTAVNALRRNKMRSALTTLGIVIGVGAVIAMVEISTGSKTLLMQTLATMGANNLLVRSGAASSGGISWGSGSEKTLTPDDATEIGRQCEDIAAVAPIVEIRGQVVRGNKNWTPMSVVGTVPDYLVVRDWDGMQAGSMFTDQDVRGALKTCVIGTTIARELFDNESPIGKDIRLQNVPLRVVGVLSPKGANMMGWDQDDVVLVPWTTAKYRISGNNSNAALAANAANGASANSGTISTDPKTLNNLYPGSLTPYPQQSSTQQLNNPQRIMFTNLDQILTKAVSAEAVPNAISQITALLHERHHMRAGQDDDFNIRDMTEIIRTFSQTSKITSTLLLIVAMISLVVGGVGIMNIMLVSVTERTKEIGVRMAVGARGYQILLQFLTEAVVLCVLGGAAGITLGRTAAGIVWYFTRWPISASYLAIVVAFAVSAIIGIGFGFYPAWKASRLDPIEALRYE